MFQEIAQSKHWLSVDRINKGWSSDEKYMVKTKQGKMLLRVSSLESYDIKRKEFEVITRYQKTGITMSQPLDFGVCGNSHERKTYMLLSWIEGQDLGDILPSLPESEQYRLGRSAGTILRKIHALQIHEDELPAQSKAPRKLQQLQAYLESDVRISNDKIAVAFVGENIDKIWQEQPVYQHGDYHPGNLIYSDDGSLGVIDFNRWEVGDPYEEFYKLESFGVEVSVPYCVGQIDAYFDDVVPDRFWLTLAVYVAHASLYSIKWAERFGADEIAGMKRRCEQAFEHYDAFRRTIPTWYEDWYTKSAAVV